MINTKDLPKYLNDIDDFIEDKNYRYHLYPKSNSSLGIIQTSNNLILKSGLVGYVSRVIHFGNEYSIIRSNSGMDRKIIQKINQIFGKYITKEKVNNDTEILSILLKHENNILEELKQIKYEEFT